MISKDPAARPVLFNLKIQLSAIRDSAVVKSLPTVSGPGTGTSTTSPASPKIETEIEVLGKQIKSLVDQIVAKASATAISPAGGGSRLKGAGLTLLTATAVSTPDKSSTLTTSLASIAEELKKIAES